MAKEIDKKDVFENMPIGSAIATLVIPTIVTQVINIIYNLADTWYVGRTNDPDMVAALTVCMPVFVLMSAFANLFGVGGSSLISRCLGMGNVKRARQTFAFSLYSGLAVAILYSLIILAFRPNIIPVIGGSSASYPYIYNYMFWTMIVGAIPTIGNVLCGHLVRSIGASKEAALGMSMGGILNMILDPIFMFVILPKGQEVVGAAIATVLSNTAALVYFVIFLVKHRSNPVMTVSPGDISFKDNIPAEVILVGLPAFLNTFMAMLSHMFTNGLMKEYGTKAVAGLGVSNKITTISFNITMGISMGVLPLVGYNYGAKNYKRMKEAIRMTFIIGVGFGIVCLALFEGFSSQLIGFFVKEAGSVAYGTRFLKIASVAMPFICVCYITNSMLQACGDKKTPLILATLRKGLCDIPLMFVLKPIFGADGIIIAMPISDTFVAVISLIVLAFFIKKINRQIESEVRAL